MIPVYKKNDTNQILFNMQNRPHCLKYKNQIADLVWFPVACFQNAGFPWVPSS